MRFIKAYSEISRKADAVGVYILLVGWG